MCERGNILARWTHRGRAFQFNGRGEILKGRLVAQRLQLERHESKQLKQCEAKQDHFLMIAASSLRHNTEGRLFLLELLWDS